MRQSNSSHTALILIATFLLTTPSWGAQLLFDADFDSAAPNDAVVTAANLDDGTAVGSWGLSGFTDVGRINSNNLDPTLAGTNNAVVFDQGEGDVEDLESLVGVFANTGNFGFGPLVTEFLWNQSRGGTDKEVHFTVNDGATAAFELVWNELNHNVYWVDSGNSQTTIKNFGSFFQGATTSWNPDNAMRVRLAITGLDTALVSLDRNNDGDFNDSTDVLDVVIGSRTAGVTQFDRFEYFFNGGANKGVWLDNITVIQVPEPGILSAALLGFLGLVFYLARRKH